MIADGIDKKIEIQIAHIMAAYGDRPKEFIDKMRDMVIEWMCKGIETGLKLKVENRIRISNDQGST